ncbi:MAG: ankyrin repeat domain-containing protein [Flavobacteriales bacterium]|nr:ankyrin repeat domain-containing protein [Flavobacteriales bacterium]
MKQFKLFAIWGLMMTSLAVNAQNPFGIMPWDTLQGRDIYGYDSRREAKNFDYNGFTQAVLTRMPGSEFKGDQVYGFTLEQLLKNNFGVDKVDPDVRFASQPAIGSCTGFLIAPDIMVTAGHCISGDQHEITDGKVIFHKNKEGNYGEFAYNTMKWVFDYTNDIGMTKKHHEQLGDYYVATIPTSKQYTVKRVLKSVLDATRNLDFAIIQLDRPTDRDPFRFRTGGEIGREEEIAMIGSPAGLPLKLADGAKVTQISEQTWFGTNLDAFGGNSGGPVYNKAGIGMLEGILVRGRIDKGLKGYFVDQSCGCVKEVKYENDEADNFLDEYGMAISLMSTEVQRITSIPLNIKVMAVYNNFKYAIEKNNKDRFNKWVIYKWAFTNDNEDYMKEGLEGQDPIGVLTLKYGRTDMFNTLVDQGMPLDVPLAEGRSMLYHAIKNKNIDAVRRILKEGHSTDFKDDYGQSPLHWAISAGDNSIIDELIKNGVDLNAKDNMGNTPLHYAVQNWDLSLIQKLVDGGANSKSTNNDGQTPRKKAQSIKYKDAVRYLKRAEKGKA